MSTKPLRLAYCFRNEIFVIASPFVFHIEAEIHLTQNKITPSLRLWRIRGEELPLMATLNYGSQGLVVNIKKKIYNKIIIQSLIFNINIFKAYLGYV